MPPSRSLLKQRQVVALVCTVFDRCTEVKLPEGERRRHLLLHELYDLRHVVSAFTIGERARVLGMPRARFWQIIPCLQQLVTSLHIVINVAT
jgi:hypothetical protein